MACMAWARQSGECRFSTVARWANPATWMMMLLLGYKMEEHNLC